MLNFLTSEPLNVVVIEDVFVKASVMEEAVRNSKVCVNKVASVFWGADTKNGTQELLLKVEKNGPDAVPYPPALDDLLEDCDVLLTHIAPVPAAVIEKAPRLKAVLTSRGGLEHIDVAACSKRNIPVVNVIRNAIPVAEMTVAFMIGITRCLGFAHTELMSGRWTRDFPNNGFSMTLSNMKVGLIGLGNIGIEVAKRLKGFECEIYAWDPFADPERLKRNGLGDMKLLETKEEVIRICDVISLHMRLVPATEGIFDRKCFEMMKPTSYFINTARGGLMDYDALIDALKERKIAGAALDVFDSEPLVDGSPLRELDNVFLTPHIGGQTEDAIPLSPRLLMREVDKILETGVTERIANFRDIVLD